MMLLKHLRSMFSRVAEIVTVVALVLLFFALVLRLLSVFFPLGPGLREFVGREGLLPRAPRVDRVVTGLGEEEEAPDPIPVAALLSLVENEVKNKPANAIAWTSARAGMDLYDRDAVQTLGRANAVIAFDEENHLIMKENSLVVLRRIEEHPTLHLKRSVVVVVNGELAGTLSGSPEAPMSMEVNMPNAVARIRSDPGNRKPAEFKVTVHPDHSSTVTVFRGSAEIQGQGEKEVHIAANQSAIVRPSGMVMPPRPLPPTPKPVSLGADVQLAYRDLPPRVTFAWHCPSPVEAFHLVVARDSEFQSVIIDEEIVGDGYTHGNLKAGEYHWRVSARDGLAEGRFSASESFRLVQDAQPPNLHVEFPTGTVHADAVALRGETEAGARVFVGGTSVPTSETGGFEHRIQLDRGINVIVVEAVDEVGNVAYQSERLHAKF